MTEKLLPRRGVVIVRPIPLERVLASGIILPNTIKPERILMASGQVADRLKPIQADVIAVGLGARLRDGIAPVDLMPGDRVLVGMRGGAPLYYDNQYLVALNQSMVLAIVSKPVEVDSAAVCH